ncbi:MAG: hypothetical protein KAI43_06215 [Candidatus Aureabacteria bacterium]|nr:hypothetical protein [Candidatus Auribacterota bacterium]
MKMKKFVIVLLLIWLFPKMLFAQETSPHLQAIKLVLETQKELISQIDKEELKEKNWWHDTESRNWDVKRPFYPGSIDSTHLFVVIYKINNTAVAEWLVDLKAKKVTKQSN